MRFYQQQHRFYCGVDLHARTMYLCIVDPAGAILFHQNLPADAQAFREAIGPYRDGLVVACECMFAWYWLADLCQAEGVAFVLGQRPNWGTPGTRANAGQLLGRKSPSRPAAPEFPTPCVWNGPARLGRVFSDTKEYVSDVGSRPRPEPMPN